MIIKQISFRLKLHVYPNEKGCELLFEHIWISLISLEKDKSGHLSSLQYIFVISLLSLLDKKVWFFIWIDLLFHYYIPLEKGVPFHLNKFDFSSPNEVLCYKISWNWLSSCREEEFWMSLVYFRYFYYYLPFEKDMTLHLHKHNHLHFTFSSYQTI